MAICRAHLRFFQEIFALPGFLCDPILIMGVQDIFHGTPEIDKAMPFPTVREYLLSLGFENVKELDWQDPRAELRVDLSIPSDLGWRANTIIDIGTIEHVANPHVVLQNYVNWLNVGGHLLVHTPVRGYLGHGLFTFSPEYIPDTLQQNGFEIVYEKYASTIGDDAEMDKTGNEPVCSCPKRDGMIQMDIATWVLGKKLRELDGTLVPIQQKRYR